MVPLSKQLKPFQRCGAIEQWVAPTRFLDDYCFQCKTGWLGVLMKTAGINYEARTPGMLADVSKRIKSALRSLEPDFALYQYVEKRRVRSFPSEKHFGDTRLDAAVKSRLDFWGSETYSMYRFTGPCCTSFAPPCESSRS